MFSKGSGILRMSRTGSGMEKRGNGRLRRRMENGMMMAMMRRRKKRRRRVGGRGWR